MVGSWFYIGWRKDFEMFSAKDLFYQRKRAKLMQK